MEQGYRLRKSSSFSSNWTNPPKPELVWRA
jgi:hypothetical protein